MLLPALYASDFPAVTWGFCEVPSAPSNLVKDRVERARKAFDPREQGTELGTHIQVVGEDHGAGSVAKGESLAELAPLSTQPGHVHASLLQAFPD